jgi:NAD(P)-dependent dehydrogenase (short-subunit alcohol dehydrogenase family)
MPELDGKVALITGGSKGIGRAIALAFAREGAHVSLGARGPEELEGAAKEIKAEGRRALAVPTDVTDADQVEALIRTTVEELGGIDILVNNAGAAPFMSMFDQIRLSGFQKYFGITYTGAVYTTRAAASALLERRGSVINIASVAAYIASPGLTYYASAKAALVSFTRTLALEWAGHRVRVNAIAPGWIETEMNALSRQDPGFYQTILNQIPLGRWGTADDVASVALFLASERASFMTGSVILVDGGQTLSALAGP